MDMFILLISGWLGLIFLPKGGDGLPPAYHAVQEVYCRLNPEDTGLKYEAFEYAYQGWLKLQMNGKLSTPAVLGLVDFTLPSNEKRLYLIDMNQMKLIHQTYVAHGRNSGIEKAERFSNTPGSFQSSPGFYTTGATYSGKHGYSLKLAGLQKGINDLAEPRAIVLHGADYANPEFIKQNGRLGRSLGCPAVPENEVSDIINTLKTGACFCIYVPGTPGL
jgi:hypothetical protein